ncbi:unnamed protein product, partial [Didymodactylos carnosus]
VITDHHPLCWLNKQSSKNGRLDRWSLQLQEYSFNIKHASGRSNCVADCLSRYPVEQPDNIADQQLEVMTGPMNNINMAIILNYFTLIIKLLYDQLKMGHLIKSFELETGLILKIIERRGQSKLKLPLMPTSMIQELLHAYDDNPTSGHLGLNLEQNS